MCLWLSSAPFPLLLAAICLSSCWISFEAALEFDPRADPGENIPSQGASKRGSKNDDQSHPMELTPFPAPAPDGAGLSHAPGNPGSACPPSAIRDILAQRRNVHDQISA